METFKNIVKNGLVFGIVGVLLASSAPYLAAAVGGEAVLGAAAVELAGKIGGMALWEGAFFGAFGAIHAAVAPAMDWIFSNKKEKTTTKATTKEDKDHYVVITNTQLQPDVAVDAKANMVFTEMLEKQATQIGQPGVNK